MIEIKQEQEGFYDIELETEEHYVYITPHIIGNGQDDSTVLHRDNLPTLISHLIEMGGVAEDLPYAILSSLSIEQIVKHYHLVPKKKI